MIIVKIVCTKCGKKYKSHGRHPINPSFRYSGILQDLLLTPDDIYTLKNASSTDIELWKDHYPYGILVLNYIKSDQQHTVRTECDNCKGPLKAYAMSTEKTDGRREEKSINEESNRSPDSEESS